MKKTNVSFILAALCLLSLFATSAFATGNYEIPKVDGTVWMDASNSEKLSYILGMETIIDLDQDAQGEKPAEHSLINGWVQKLSQYSIKEVVEKLDRFYQTYPNHRDRQVVEVLWYDFNPEYMTSK